MSLILVLFFALVIIATILFIIAIIAMILNKRHVIVDYDSNYYLIEIKLINLICDEDILDISEIEYVDITLISLSLFFLMHVDKKSFKENFKKYFNKYYEEIIF